MKRIVALLFIAALALTGCHNMITDDGGITVYASFNPIYALLKEIVRDVPNLKVECLTQPLIGCPRSYELSDWDSSRLSMCDALFVGGRGLESFGDMLEGADFAVVEVMQTLTLLNDGQETPAGDDEASHFAGENPWAWLAVEGAAGICESMAAAMMRLDPQYEEIYARNLEGMTERLDELKTFMADAMPDVRPGAAVMHEGIEYLAEELGISVLAVIERESGEDMDEESAIKAIETIKACGADIVLLEKQAPAKLVKRLADAGLKTVVIDTVTYRGGENLYFAAMRENALAIAEALT